MNWIQQYILLELTRHSTRRYSELRPDGVEGNLFLYHLNGLIKVGLVAKTDSLYQLTSKGLQEIANLSLETGKARRQPLVLTTVIARNEAGEVLLYHWQREPNAGLVSPPHGMVHWGETLMEAATRELAEKAAFTGAMSYRGAAAIRVVRDDIIGRHMVVHVYTVTNLRSIEEQPSSHTTWAAPSAHSSGQWVPGFDQLVSQSDQLTSNGLLEIEA